jgi:F-type H+-transporting ATPase subunit epsilon
MILEIITPEKTLFKGEVRMVRVPGTSGSFAILRHHAAIVSTLNPGFVKVIAANKREFFFELFDSAIVENHDDCVTILAENIKEALPPKVV